METIISILNTIMSIMMAVIICGVFQAIFQFYDLYHEYRQKPVITSRDREILKRFLEDQ